MEYVLVNFCKQEEIWYLVHYFYSMYTILITDGSEMDFFHPRDFFSKENLNSKCRIYTTKVSICRVDNSEESLTTLLGLGSMTCVDFNH